MSEERRDSSSRPKRKESRRSIPSSRIRALADEYESRIAAEATSASSNPRTNEKNSSGQRTASIQYARLGDMDWQARKRERSPTLSVPTLVDELRIAREEGTATHLDPSPGHLVAPSVRQVDAHPTRPQANLSLTTANAPKRQYDGLPSSSGTTIPNFSTVSGGSDDKTACDNESEDQSQKTVDSIGGQQRRQNAHNDYLTSVRAVPAHEVFANDAMPLHLPDLDSYVSDRTIFPAPCFTVPSDVCSQEESELYGWNTKARLSALGKYEMCGDQIEVPRTPLRHRNRAVDVTAREDEKVDSLSDENGCANSLSGSDTIVGSEQDQVDYKTELKSVEKESAVFPPLMLLKDNSLDELKSNAVGPRKPPGGFLGSLPGCGSLLGTFVDFVVGVEGSTLAAGVFRLQMFIDFVQIMNLNLHFTSDMRSVSGSYWSANHILLHVVPAAVSLDFVSIFGAAIIVLYALTGFVAVLLLLFWRMTKKYNPNRTLEGYSSQPWLFRLVKRTESPEASNRRQSAEESALTSRSNVWTKFCNVSVVVLLTVLYIPLSKLAVDALVWSVDYWPLQTDGKATTADMQGFCYRTSLNGDDFNWAFVIMPVSALTVVFYTLWFPYQMRRTIADLLPRVNGYNELGNKRTNGDLETEYMRLLSRDASPLNFMYNAYRRRWGTYKPLYILCFKLSNLLIIGVVTKQNCLFHKFDVRKMLVAQQSMLIGMQSLLLVAHISIQPFVDMLSNRSEMVSRIGYVSTAVIGLLVAVQVEGSTVYQSALLYVVQALTYSGNIYFSIASTSWMSHLIKRKQNRVDFSIDIFSPILELDKHIKRRIWQETLSLLLLSGAEYRMPIGRMVTFSASDDWPPYLLQFCGTAAERHVENLKILKAIGMDKYRGTIDRMSAKEDADRWSNVIERIQTQFTGVDAYWQPLNNDDEALNGVTSYFGKAFLVPFPPTLVIRYDQTVGAKAQPTLQLTTLEQLEMFVWQNESSSIQRRRWVREVFRSLDGQNVYCPHTRVHKQSNASTGLPLWRTSYGHGGKQYTMAKPTYYEDGVLHVRHGVSCEDEFVAGFEVFITYEYGQTRDAGGLTVDRQRYTIDATAAFGLREDFELTQSVDLFFRDNEASVAMLLPQVKDRLQDYRMRYHKEAAEKGKTMDYSFLTDIFDEPVTDSKTLRAAFRSSSCSRNVQHLPFRYPAATTTLLGRTKHVTRTKVQKWWYVFWDDLWRQNNGDFDVLRNNKRLFNPQYPSSIAYDPMTRTRLEALLRSKDGLWDDQTVPSKKRGLFSPGFLNRIYFTLDEIAFERSKGRSNHRSGQPLVVGTMNEHGSIVQRSIATISIASEDVPTTPHRKATPIYADPFAVASRYTGGGTDQDNSSIVERYAWPWTEERLNGRPAQSTMGRWKEKVLEWLSVRPYKIHDDTSQLFVFLRVVDGRYVAASLPSRNDA